jgi:hypothetical protein
MNNGSSLKNSIDAGFPAIGSFWMVIAVRQVDICNELSFLKKLNSRYENFYCRR